MQPVVRRILTYGTPAVLLVAAWGATRGAIVETRPKPTFANPVYRPKTNFVAGPQRQMIFIGASTCAWSTRNEMPELVESMKAVEDSLARLDGVRFTTLGVATDWKPANGIAFLARFGVFDELLVGGSWWGLAGQLYFWDEFSGPAATPQVLLVEREVVTGQDSVTVGSWSYRNQKLITRANGTRAIQRLIESRRRLLIKKRVGSQR